MIVVVGASRGLGAVVARRAVTWDNDVVLASRSETALQEVASQISQNAAHVEVATVDLSMPESIDQFIQQLARRNKPLRALVITAAGFYKGALLDEDPASMDTLLNTTVVGPVKLITGCLRSLPRADIVDVFNVTSVAAATNLDTSRSSVLHVVTKAAAHLFGVASGRELSSQGIRMCSIAPGTFEKDPGHGVPRETVADCIEFAMRLPAQAWIESLVIKPSGAPPR